MRWYARPENKPVALRVAPRLASWNKADARDQVRLREYRDDTEALLAKSRIHGQWALRLDVGLPLGRDLLGMSDLDNFAYPLAYRLRDAGLVSVWCTKQHSERSFVRIDAAREVAAPSTEVSVARTTAAASTVAYKEQVRAAIEDTPELPDGPVKVELSFVVGKRRNWVNLWKQTIDALGPILGLTNPNRAWHPRDGRIIELGMHVSVDTSAGNNVVVGIAAAPIATALGANTAGGGVLMAKRQVVFQRRGLCAGKWKLPDGAVAAWDIAFPHWPTPMQMSTEQAEVLRDALVEVLGESATQ